MQPNHMTEIGTNRRWRVALLAGLLAASSPMALAIAEQTPPPAASAPAPERSTGFAGTVVETMDAGRYTYVLVNTGKEKRWAAAPVFATHAGDQVLVSAGIEMRDFPSQSLNRTFESVFFAERITVTDPAHGAMASRSAAAGPNERTRVAPGGHFDFSAIKRPKGSLTVAEVYAQKAKLADRPVLLVGKVVKFTPQVMGKNWLHIKDGTGTPGANDLTVTTTNTVQVGDTVLVKGKLTLDKDFGYGYKYATLIEDSQVTVEPATTAGARK